MKRRAKKSKPRPTPVVYTISGSLGTLVTLERGRLVGWPAVGDGWSRRSAYTGPDHDLIPAPISAAYGTGWHRAKPPRSEKVARFTAQKSVKFSPELVERIDRARGKRKLNAWLRDAVELAFVWDGDAAELAAVLNERRDAIDSADRLRSENGHLRARLAKLETEGSPHLAKSS